MRLRKYLSLLALILISTGYSTPPSQAQNVSGAATGAAMANADVIALVGAGMSDDIVTAKIQAAPATAFDTSVKGLTALRAANVPAAVIRIMINPHSAAAPASPFAGATSAPGGNPDDPAAQHSPGIYTLSHGADGQVHMVRLETTRPRGSKNSGIFLHAITQGIATSKTQQVIDGASAAIELSQSRPVFYVYIPDSGGSFTGGMSVKDLVLTKFEVKGDTRLWTFAARGLFGGSSEVGSDERDRQGFATEQIKPGIYKLTPAADLTTGQYAFKYLGSYFDFGVQPAPAGTSAVLPQPVRVPAQPQPPPPTVTGKTGDCAAGPGLLSCTRTGRPATAVAGLRFSASVTDSPSWL